MNGMNKLLQCCLRLDRACGASGHNRKKQNGPEYEAGCEARYSPKVLGERVAALAGQEDATAHDVQVEEGLKLP
jgi:hypothetical protein